MNVNLFEDLENILISDTHIESSDDAKYMVLLELLSSFLNKPGIKNIIFLGDIFDFCTGSSSYFKKKFKLLGSLLEHLCKNNISIYFIEGNHEFYMSDLKWKGVSCSRGDPYLKIDIAGKSVLLTHGDMLTPSRLYRFYNYIVRSRLVKWIVTYCIKMSVVEYLSIKYSHMTRKMHVGNEIKQDLLESKLASYMSDKKADVLLFGHFHRFFTKWNKDDESVKNLNLTEGYIGLPWWDRPRFINLGFKNRKIQAFEFESGVWKLSEEKNI